MLVTAGELSGRKRDRRSCWKNPDRVGLDSLEPACKKGALGELGGGTGGILVAGADGRLVLQLAAEERLQ